MNAVTYAGYYITLMYLGECRNNLKHTSRQKDVLQCEDEWAKKNQIMRIMCKLNLYKESDTLRYTEFVSYNSAEAWNVG